MPDRGPAVNAGVTDVEAHHGVLSIEASLDDMR